MDRENPNFSFYPERQTYKESANSRKMAILRKGTTLGLQLQKDFPDIAVDYRSGLSQMEIVTKYQLVDKYKVTPALARIAVNSALRGYDGSVNFYGLQSYNGLIANPDELAQLATKHHKANAKAQGKRAKSEQTGIFALTKEQRQSIGRQAGLETYANKTAVHSMTPAEQKAAGMNSALARGFTPFSEEEETYAFMLMQQDENKLPNGYSNTAKIAKILNEKFHGGKEIRKNTSVTDLVRNRKNKGIPRKKTS